MKLGPIAIEEALLSAASAQLPAPIYGPVEQGLRYALSLFGQNGEYWIQKREKDYVPARRIREPVYQRPVFPMWAPGTVVSMEVREREIPSGIGYCTIGAINATHEATKNDVLMDQVHDAWHHANGQFFSNIVLWNDHPQRAFDHVRAAFEKAIAYAHERGL